MKAHKNTRDTRRRATVLTLAATCASFSATLAKGRFKKKQCILLASDHLNHASPAGAGTAWRQSSETSAPLHSPSRSHACCVPRKSLTNNLVIVSNPRRSGSRPLRPIGGKLIRTFPKSKLSRTPVQQHQSSLIWIRGGLVLSVRFP